MNGYKLWGSNDFVCGGLEGLLCSHVLANTRSHGMRDLPGDRGQR